jgi:hypothetical protein
MRDGWDFHFVAILGTCTTIYQLLCFHGTSNYSGAFSMDITLPRLTPSKTRHLIRHFEKSGKHVMSKA